MDCDYLIVGAGLTGAVMAERLTRSGRRVVVLERRSDIAGNIHDSIHPSGIPIHTYGPHYFRTNSERIWDYANSFSRFYPFEARLRSWVDGRFERWPVTKEYIQRTVGEDWKAISSDKITNFTEACQAMMPNQVYESFVKGYTEKQWGVPCETLSAQLAGRFEVCQDDDDRLKKSRYQGIPEFGYREWVRNILKDVPVILNASYREFERECKPRCLTIYTGPLDEYFDFSLGRLPYRGQKRSTTYYPEKDLIQPVVQVNYPSPSDGAHIRSIEWKHILSPEMRTRIKGSLVTIETPFSPSEPVDLEYPFPSADSRSLYQRYRDLADTKTQFLFCGRLGEYRYLDMDQSIARALVLAERVLAADQSITFAIEKIRETEAQLDALSSAVANEPVVKNTPA